MGKSLYIAEKPSVAMEFAKALKIEGARKDGYLEGEDAVVTWCVGHLVTMSYPDVYDPALKRWTLSTIPFFPKEWKYEVLSPVKKQFQIVARLLNRSDVDTIYVCTDSGREGEYIYRLVRQEAHVSGKSEKRVWIDSQTEEEIRRGVNEAKDLSEYDHLSDSAYLRAKEDYLMGINFSRAMTLKFGPVLADVLKSRYEVISVGRVMTCVLGMVVRREREIRDFVPTPFYRVTGIFSAGNETVEAEWRAVKGSKYYESPALYKENGFRKREDAEALCAFLEQTDPRVGILNKIERKTEKKSPPLFFNLAELQNECSKKLKISPDETLNLTQKLYEKKLVTYPRTDARVLSTAVAKVIRRNVAGLKSLPILSKEASYVMEEGNFARVSRMPYTNDKEITDHYAIIPTGQTNAFSGLSEQEKAVYELIVRRFLAAFCPQKVTEKTSLEIGMNGETLFASYRFMKDPGFLRVLDRNHGVQEAEKDKHAEGEMDGSESLKAALNALKKGDALPNLSLNVREGETTPPKRYTSGSLVLAMENAGQFIEDESLREQIRGSGIGTSATRAEIIKKLTTIGYLDIRKKTQVVTPKLKGELIYDTVEVSLRQLLNPDLTASWEKGLSYVAEGTVSESEYMDKMTAFVRTRTEGVKNIEHPESIRPVYLRRIGELKSQPK
ncbi:MAG: type IA DNA topoisomerase [Lachnospiraceae bacterium]|nr:type IA DNA topoisomerase [Lachnospiraceae bacterium]